LHLQIEPTQDPKVAYVLNRNREPVEAGLNVADRTPLKQPSICTFTRQVSKPVVYWPNSNYHAALYED